MLKNEEIRELWQDVASLIPGLNRSEQYWMQKIRDLILSHIEVHAEAERANFWLSYCGEAPDEEYYKRKDWTPAQWFEAKRKEILGE